MKKIVVFFLIFVAVRTVLVNDRYDTFLFGVDYYPEHWPESYWEQDALKMKECGVNVVRMGEFAWAYFEPSEGLFQFDLLDKAIEVLAKQDIKIILGTPTAAPPKWLTSRYPEVLPVNADGVVLNDQSRRHYNYNSPLYKNYCRKIVTKMCEHFKDNPNIIGWQIDNEFNCSLTEFYSENDRIAFRSYLKDKYVSLEKLNERWGNMFWSQWYTDWQQVDLPFPAPTFHNPALMLDYKRFISLSAINFCNMQVEVIRHFFPNVFITHNDFHAKNINFYDLGNKVDILSIDNYPCFNELPQYSVGTNLAVWRGYNGRFFVMEQQTGPGGQAYLLRSPRPGEMKLWSMQAVAHGAEGLIHFRWRTCRQGAEEYWCGVLDFDNIPRDRFEEFKQEGKDLLKIAPEIFGSEIKSEIAVIYDFDAEWVYDYQYLTRETNVRSANEFFFRAAQEQKYNLDFISPQADFSKYKLVFAPYYILMSEYEAKKIEKYIRQGGTFVLAAHGAVKDRDNGMTAESWPIYLTDVFGMTIDKFHCYQPPSDGKNAIRFHANLNIPVNVFADILKPTTAAAVAIWRDDYMAAKPAVTENVYGSGKAVYYGSFINQQAASVLLERYAGECKIDPIIKGIPEQVEVTRRTKDNQHYFFILNHSEKNLHIDIGSQYYDIIRDKTFSQSFIKPLEYFVIKNK